MRYEIRLKGHLAPRWAAWFDGFSLTRERDGTTLLSGPVVDQAELHGVLRKFATSGCPCSRSPASTQANRTRPSAHPGKYPRQHTTHKE